MARALLELALQLLIAAQAANVPTDLKIQAIQTATYAIEFAQASMPEDNTHPLGNTDISELLPLVDDTAVEVEIGGITKGTYGAIKYDETTKSPFIYGKSE